MSPPFELQEPTPYKWPKNLSYILAAITENLWEKTRREVEIYDVQVVLTVWWDMNSTVSKYYPMCFKVLIRDY